MQNITCMKITVILTHLVGKTVIPVFSSVLFQILPFAVYLAAKDTIWMVVTVLLALKTVTLVIMLPVAMIVHRIASHVIIPPPVKLAAPIIICMQNNAIIAHPIWPIVISLLTPAVCRATNLFI